MSVAELKARHVAATETVNSLRERLKQKRLLLLDTDGIFCFFVRFYCVLKFLVFFELDICVCFLPSFWISFSPKIDLIDVMAVAGYARAQGKSQVSFGATDLVCCRTLQGHTGKVNHKRLLYTI